MTASKRFSRFLRFTLIFLTLSALLSCFALISYAEEDESGLDIEITLNKEKYSEGDSAIIMISLTNNTGKKLENVSVRYYIPECFELSDPNVAEIGVLNSRQTVRSQINAVAKSEIRNASDIEKDTEKDNTKLYVALIIISILVFTAAVTLLIIRERNRRKIAATISFVLAFIFCLSPFFTLFDPISAKAVDIAFADTLSYDDSKNIVKKLLPDVADGMLSELSASTSLTREKVAIIASLMLLGKEPLPELNEKPYLDVSLDSFSAPYIKLVTSAGIIPSISPNRFDPDSEISGYDFLKCMLSASGFGKNGEYGGQNGKANVITDALNLPYADVSKFLTEKAPSCAEALAFALQVMINPSAELSAIGNYTFTGEPIILQYENISIISAISADKNLLLTETGEKLETPKKVLTEKAYKVIYLDNVPTLVSADFSSIENTILPIYSGKESRHIGASIEYTFPIPNSKYDTYIGLFNEDNKIFTSENTHYIVEDSAVKDTLYMLDAKLCSKDKIDSSKVLTFIASTDKSSVTQSMQSIVYIYQLSSTDPANYDSFNTALIAAKDISNDNNTFLQSAYETFLETISEIDRSLDRTLTDTDESRVIISSAEDQIAEAISELEKYMLASYAALDRQIASANALSKGAYTQESFAAVEKALREANSLSRELLMTQENEATIASHAKAISDAISALEFSDYCNYIDYNQTLKSALAITNTDGKYDASVFAAFKKKINQIDGSLNKKLPRSEENQKIVDTARENLIEAIDALTADLPCNYEALDAAIESAKEHVDNSDYRWTAVSHSHFMKEYEAALKVDRNMTIGYGSTNQSIINAAAVALNSAASSLVRNSFCSYSAYNTALKKAEAVEFNAEKHTESSFKIFSDTILEIKNGLPDKLYSSAENKERIAKATENLNRAIEILEKQEKCDYTKLDEMITLGEAASTEEKPYTEISLAALTTAIAEAKALERDLETDALLKNQFIIEAATLKIEEAIKALVIKETFASEVISDVYEKTIEGGAKVFAMKLFTKDGEKEFILADNVNERPNALDFIIVTVGADVIYEIEIASVSLETYIKDTHSVDEALKDIVFASKNHTDPIDSKPAVFFKNSEGKILFISTTTEKISEIIYSDSSLYLAGIKTPILTASDFSAFSEATIAKVVFAGKYAVSAETLRTIESSISLDSKGNIVYGDDKKALSASKTAVELSENSIFYTLDTLKAFLKAEGALGSYEATLYLDEGGALISCIVRIPETPDTPENPDAPENPEHSENPENTDNTDNT